MDPTFIMSTERSGSNLVRKMLGAHPDIAAPPPAHHLIHLSRILPYYGPLTDDSNFEDLVYDAVVMTQVENSHLEWKHDIEVDDVLERVTARNLPGVLEAMYDEVADREEALGWACKENRLWEDAFAIRDTIPDAKFVYLCRDGRDVAVSMQNVPTHDEHVYYIAREWFDHQLLCLEVVQELAAHDAALILKYEDLIETPEDELRRVCEFVDVEYHPRMLGFHKLDETQEAADKTVFWENLSKPVMSDNKGKFYDQLTERERQIFESVAGNGLEMLGYPLQFPDMNLDLSYLEKKKIETENWLKKQLHERELEEEAGRKERSDMLSSLYERRTDCDSYQAFVERTSY